MFKTVEDLQKLGRTQFEAATQSAAALSRGLQLIATETSDFSKKSIEESSAVFTKLIAVKSLTGAIEVQTDYAKSYYESLVGQYTKVGELMASVAKDAYKPYEGAFSQATAS